jgi:hypothetical protein
MRGRYIPGDPGSRDGSEGNRETATGMSTRIGRNRSKSAWAIPLLMLFWIGCASPPTTWTPIRVFDFERDTFAYTNNNYWIYDLDSASGGGVKERREDVDHGQRCTIMARATRQFWYAARFDPDGPTLADSEYRQRVERVLASDPRLDRPLEVPIVIPGFADLRSLSLEKEELLKDALGGRWIGYFQRGNWRMIFPFTPDQKRATATELVADLDRGHLPLVHVFNYPRININHTVLLFDYEATPLEISFALYDPNNAEESGSLVYDRATASFRYWRTDYFAGGPTDVYEIYDGLRF